MPGVAATARLGTVYPLRLLDLGGPGSSRTTHPRRVPASTGSMRPSRSSNANALRTVSRDTPAASASRRSLGSRSPGTSRFASDSFRNHLRTRAWA